MSVSQNDPSLPALVQDADRETLNQRVHRDVMRKLVLSEQDMREAWADSERTDSGYGQCGAVFFRCIPHRIVGGEPRFEQEVPDYAGNWFRIRLVEDEIERRGLGRQYAMALDFGLDLHATELDSHDFAWRLLRASCEDRCKAALAVCGALHDRRTDA